MKSHWSSPCFAIAAIALGLQIASPPVLAQASAHDDHLQPHASTLRHAGSARNVSIGAAADPRHFDETEYESTLAEQFDQLQPENQMKFAIIHPRPSNELAAYNFLPGDQLVDSASQHNMKVRGHCFVWHQQVPE